MSDQAFPRRAKGPRPHYFDDPAIDQLHAIVLAMSAEIATLYERCDTLERLLAARGVLGEGAVDAFAPDAAAIETRAAQREALIGRLFRALREDRESLPEAADGAQLRDG